MTETSGVVQERSKDNNFGLLRVLLAALVVVSHSPELIDGNRSREPLTLLTGTLSFGELAVDGFFVISGYLITLSCVKRHSVTDFLLRRIFRIVPGFIVSFVLCVLLVSPLAGVPLSSLKVSDIARLLSEVIRLIPPNVPGVFSGLPYQALNGSMWTIAYEMRCYVLALVLGLTGVYRPQMRFVVFAGAILLITMSCLGAVDGVSLPGATMLGAPENNVRLMGMFLAGASMYLFREKIQYRSSLAIISAIAFGILIRLPGLANLVVAVLGSYLIFWTAFGVRPFQVSRLVNRTDISYGLYLYAFPIQNLLNFFLRPTHPWLLTIMALPIACLAGYLSWTLIEKPSLRLSNHLILAHRRRLEARVTGSLASGRSAS